MCIKYTGVKTQYDVDFERKSYHFTKENNRTLEIKDKLVIHHIFRLDNRFEFEVVEQESLQPIKQDAIIPEEPIKKKPGRPKKEN